MLNNKPLSLSTGGLNVCKAENLSECPTDSTEGVGTPACATIVPRAIQRSTPQTFVLQPESIFRATKRIK